MAGLVKKSLGSPEEIRPFKDAMGQIELVNLPEGVVGRAVFQPGWQWSKHVKPIAGTASCMAAHLGCVLAGQMTVRMDDGQEETFGPGDVMSCLPGHDAWIVGNERCVVIDWTGAADYAKSQG